MHPRGIFSKYGILLAISTVTLSGAGCSIGAGTMENSGTKDLKSNRQTKSEIQGSQRDDPARANDYTFTLPIAEFSYSRSDLHIIRTALNQFTQDCMKRYGITYKIPDAADRNIMADRRYGLSSLTEAAKYGYDLPTYDEPETAKGLSNEASLVLHGTEQKNSTGGKIRVNGLAVTPTGCAGEAQSRVSASSTDPRGAAAAQNIATSSFQESLRAPRAQKAIISWSSCMKEHGYDFKSPLEATGNLDFHKPSPSPSESKKEINTATADVTCKNKTGLLTTWFSVESAIQEHKIAADRTVLMKLKNTHTSVVTRVTKEMDQPR
ncbi:hypothetical protein [Streptomyces sp. AK02-01A]|uniref:hypothetical protein n=1 Tax=Streptomyces sp. AK02-01A TaxID=3028648 RepID=UPI0029AB1446|nr:hypothetical protein [Streptomyces sp. AK02-01A]MDX3853012.1 hypothetical protein [Streptomyces sp. AK02-01A]